jgi:hypothetical protein
VEKRDGRVLAVKADQPMAEISAKMIGDGREPGLLAADGEGRKYVEQDGRHQLRARSGSAKEGVIVPAELRVGAIASSPINRDGRFFT